MRASAKTLGWYLSIKRMYLSTLSPVRQRSECLLQKALYEEVASLFERGFPLVASLYPPLSSSSWMSFPIQLSRE